MPRSARDHEEAAEIHDAAASSTRVALNRRALEEELEISIAAIVSGRPTRTQTRRG